MKFGDYLRIRRETRGISVRELARRVGIDPSYISKIEHGDTQNPSEDVLKAVAGVLEVNPHLFMAMAGKVSQAFLEAMQHFPEDFALIIARLEKAPKHAISQVARAVRDGDW